LIQNAHGTPPFAQGFVAAGCPWRIEYEGALYHAFFPRQQPARENIETMVTELTNLAYEFTAWRVIA